MVSLLRMKYAALKRLHREIELAIQRKREEERTKLRGDLEARIRAAGLTVDEVLGRRPGGKVSIKYRDPDNPDNLWTGRGCTPRWLRRAMQGGRKREDYLL